jgi:hypothetical protein
VRVEADGKAIVPADDGRVTLPAGTKRVTIEMASLVNKPDEPRK